MAPGRRDLLPRLGNGYLVACLVILGHRYEGP